MSGFYIDFKELGRLLLPSFLRSGLFEAFIRAIMTGGVHATHDGVLGQIKRDGTTVEQQPINFVTARENDLFLLNHAAQTCKIKDALDQKFWYNDDHNRTYGNGFQITDEEPAGVFILTFPETGIDKSKDVFIAYSEGKDETMRKIGVVWSEASCEPKEATFTIWIPEDLGINPDDETSKKNPTFLNIKSWVELLHLPGRTAKYKKGKPPKEGE